MANQDDPFNLESAQGSMAEIMAECTSETNADQPTKWSKMREAFKTGALFVS
jgi:hypothetical protein